MIPLLAVALWLRDAVRHRVLSAAYPRLEPHPPPPPPNRPLEISARRPNGALPQMLHFPSELVPCALKVLHCTERIVVFCTKTAPV